MNQNSALLEYFNDDVTYYSGTIETDRNYNYSSARVAGY